MFLDLLHRVADSSLLMALACAMEFLAVKVMSTRNEKVLSYGAGAAPDLLFSFTPNQMYQWLTKLGEDGRQAYMEMVAWDLVPYTQCYAILLGSLLLQQTRQASLTPQIALIFPVTMIFDLLQTFICGFATKEYPQPVSNSYLEVASMANQLKWASGILGMILLSVLFVYNSLRPSSHDDKKKEK